MKNNYYDIAYNNLLYLEYTLQTEFYNDIAVQCQQISEKMLKSALEEVCTTLNNDIDKLMHSHNLRALYDKVHQVDADFLLDRGKLSMLKDYYFDAKYPGDNFVTVTKDECIECVQTMYTVVQQVNLFRKRNNLPYVEVEAKVLSGTSPNAF